tara:strand:- start:2796 stop:3263 length:468 start_codon:yes stop_codon:yes gene_type:complete
MTAFNTAWAIVKMPIIPNTVKEVDNNKWMGRRYQGDFYDPKSKETMPIVVYDNDDYISGFIGEGYGNKARSESEAQKTYYQDMPKMMATGVETDEPFRRRGYATALYDLMAHVLANRPVPLDLMPDESQTYEAGQLWRTNAPDYIWPKDRVEVME